MLSGITTNFKLFYSVQMKEIIDIFVHVHQCLCSLWILILNAVLLMCCSHSLEHGEHWVWLGLNSRNPQSFRTWRWSDGSFVSLPLPAPYAHILFIACYVFTSK